jgi:hypothetical protein
MAELVSQRAAAKTLGMALSTLQHHIKTGKVPLIEGRVNLEVARVLLAAKVDPTQAARARGGRDAFYSDRQSGADLPISPEAGDLVAEKTRRERTLADLADLELAEKRGELLRRSDVERAWAPRLVALRERLLSLPDRVTALMRAAPDEHAAHAVLAAELHQALSDLTAAAPAAPTNRAA